MEEARLPVARGLVVLLVVLLALLECRPVDRDARRRGRVAKGGGELLVEVRVDLDAVVVGQAVAAAARTRVGPGPLTRVLDAPANLPNGEST